MKQFADIKDRLQSEAESEEAMLPFSDLEEYDREIE